VAEPLTLFLIGYRGSGKTVVGRRIASALGAEFVDTDDCIVRREGRSITEIFRSLGEPGFRAIERDVIRAICDRSGAERPLIVATGGGVVLAIENREAMRNAGIVIWLDAGAETLRARIASDDGAERPALRGVSATAEVERVLAERRPLYEATANASVVTDGRSPDQVARAVVEAIRAI
jgi:shikimate kinase